MLKMRSLIEVHQVAIILLYFELHLRQVHAFCCQGSLAMGALVPVSYAMHLHMHPNRADARQKYIKTQIRAALRDGDG